MVGVLFRITLRSRVEVNCSGDRSRFNCFVMVSVQNVILIER